MGLYLNKLIRLYPEFEPPSLLSNIMNISKMYRTCKQGEVASMKEAHAFVHLLGYLTRKCRFSSGRKFLEKSNLT